MLFQLFMLLIAGSNVLTIACVFGAEYESPNETGICPPNAQWTGFFCDNITLGEAWVSHDELNVTMDYNNTFDPSMMSFWTSVQVFTSFVTNQMLMDFWFNSSTPNNSILTSGSKYVGMIEVQTGNILVPTIPLNHTLTYIVTLENWECEPPMNQTPAACQSGTLVSHIGLNVTGVTSQPGFNVRVWINEPKALTVYFPFDYVVNETWYCRSIEFQTVWNRNIELYTEVCTDIPGFPCHTDSDILNLTGEDQNKTFVDDCFLHSFNNQTTNQTMLRGGWRV